MIKKADKLLIIQNYSKVEIAENFSIKDYKIGQILIIDSIKIKGFKSGQKFKIVGIKDDETLILDTISTSKIGRDRTRKGIEFSIKNNVEFVSIFNHNILNPIEIKVGSKILFTRRIYDKDNKNVTIARVGNIGRVLDIEESTLTLELSFGKIIHFDALENNFFESALK